MKRLLTTIWLVLAVAGVALSQRVVSGTVSGDDGETLIGATVRVKDSRVGTFTDVNGRYTLEVPDGGTILVVNYTGYATQEITLGTSNVVDVVLKAGIQLEETVVTALNINRSEKSLGYAVEKIDGSDLTNVRDANIVNQLAGRAAGVQVVGSSGNLGGSSRILIRGVRSINGENQPLFVVDGVPMDNSNFTTNDQRRGGGGYDYGNTIQDINPDDIENISVLKGQAAAALYGSRGMNGVVMITTKKGNAKSRKGIGVTVTSNFTSDDILVLPDYQNRYGGGVDLRPRGYSDGSGYYKIPYTAYNSGGAVVGTYQSFDLVPFYGVDESFGTAFDISTDQHFQHLADLKFGSGQNRYSFDNGFGSNQQGLYFRDWNSWDSWDTDHFGKSRAWASSPNNPRDFFERGSTWSNGIALDGGNDRATFRLAYNRLDQSGIFPNSTLKRNTVSFNGDAKLSEKLQAFVGVNYVGNSAVGRSSTGYDGDGLNVAQMFNQWWHRELVVDDLRAYKNPDGSQRTWNRISADNPNPQYWDNPYWTRYENFQNDSRNRIFGNMGMTWKLNDWLSLTGRVLKDFYNEQREERIAVGSITTSMYAEDVYRFDETNADVILRGDRYVFNEQLNVTAFVGGNKRWTKLNRSYGSTRGGLNVPGLYRVQNSLERPDVFNTLNEREVESIFGGLTLGWKSWLYLDLTGRNDWSSTLPEANNSYFYPSASLSFVFSEFFKSNVLTFGKLRLGWAKVGGDADPYVISTVYGSNDNFGSNPSFTVPNTLNNLDLKPEETRSQEIGIDLRFFDSRIGIDATYYTGKTLNQIIPLGTTPTTGYTRQFINAGEIENKGYEISLNVVPIRTKDFSWDVTFNVGKNTNKIIELNADDPTLTNIPIVNAPFAVSLNAFEGQSFGTILGYDYIYDNAGNKLVDEGGFYLTTPTVVPLGSVLPDLTGGVMTSFTFKGITLGGFVDFRKGGKIFSLTNTWGKYSGLFAETAVGNIREDGVIVDGVVAAYDNDGNLIVANEGDPNVTGDEIYESTGVSNSTAIGAQDHFFANGGYVIGAADVYDGSFVKLRELSLGYTLPKRWLGAAGVQDVKVSVVGRNLAILHKNIPNVDPDSAISSGNIQGLEGGALPSTRSIGVNVSLRF
ncbi:MAG: SusC/RagA family TonB-linked outer membrane protein [Lewinellaceae bacterium]|nr:SusC/RagA family TonB-linked outer membrane protein [Lewinellaceae bacterium]